jgi:endonuclease YncB( thermonuclease family)
MFTYAAIVEHVIDGDTVYMAVDLGFDTWHWGSFRLLGCNARELPQPGGPEAAANLVALLPVGTKVTIRSVKPDKFGGRYLAAVTLADGSDLVSTLIAEGWAAAWNGTGTKPVPPWPRSP